MPDLPPPPGTWSGTQVRESFNGIPSILHYTRAAHFLGLWDSERQMLARFLPALATDVLEAGCGAGRVTLGLWKLGYRRICAFDFASELLDQAQSLAAEQGVEGIVFRVADATVVRAADLGRGPEERFGAALFMFNGLMQIPGRGHRRAALRRLYDLCAPRAPLLFTSHDRAHPVSEAPAWRAEAARWAAGRQDPRLSDFGDRRFTDESGEVFINIPSREEVIADLEATGWEPYFDALRSELAAEGPSVTAFSDDCRFWVALRSG
jgi:SAM-dependent methyltransferase